VRASILFVALLLCGACASATAGAGPVPVRTPPPPAPLAAIAPSATELRLDIVELTCHSCAGQVALGTSRIPGVLHVSAEMLDHVPAQFRVQVIRRPRYGCRARLLKVPSAKPMEWQTRGASRPSCKRPHQTGR